MVAKPKRPPPPPRKPQRQEEDEVEMDDLGEHSEDEEDLEDSFDDDDGSVTISSALAVSCLLLSAVSAGSDIPLAEFPDYVRLMHEDRDHKLELEYRVCLILMTCRLTCEFVVCH